MRAAAIVFLVSVLCLLAMGQAGRRRVLEAESFVLKDSAGRKRAELTTREDRYNPQSWLSPQVEQPVEQGQHVSCAVRSSSSFWWQRHSPYRYLESGCGRCDYRAQDHFQSAL